MLLGLVSVARLLVAPLPGGGGTGGEEGGEGVTDDGGAGLDADLDADLDVALLVHVPPTPVLKACRRAAAWAL